MANNSLGAKNIIKGAVYLLFFFGIPNYCCAQNVAELLPKLSASKTDSSRINILLQLSIYYLNKDNTSEADIDSAKFYYLAADKQNKSASTRYYLDKFVIARASYLWKLKQYKVAEDMFTELALRFHNSKQYLSEAKVWDQFGAVINLESQTNISVTDKVYLAAYNSYRLSGKKLEAAHALGRLANVDLVRGRYVKAEKEMLQVVSVYRAFKYPQIYYGYYMLAETYYRHNEMQKELIYRIECLHSFESYSKGGEYERLAYNFKLAEAYFRLKEYEKSIPYFQKSIDLAAAQDKPMLYYHITGNLVDVYATLKKYKVGLSLIRKAKEKYPPNTDELQRKILSSELRIYNHLNKGLQARQIVPDFRRVYQKNFQELSSSENYHAINTFIYTYEPLLKYYILNRQWDSLSVELEKLSTLPKGNITVISRLILNRSRFKLDSAQGRLLFALQNFQESKILQDSLNNAESKAQINELEAKYLSIKKDRTIQNLNAQAIIQKANIDRIHTQRNATIAGTIVAIFLSLLTYIGYRGKQRSNAKLKSKQEEINKQNNTLSTLIQEKDNLLSDKDNLLKKQENLIEEKEWLLKEVHHRVKNNLQIIMSLLYTQSAYLKNRDAIEAIKDSQNRIQAISIIHQKLYNKSEVGHVSLPEYVGELVNYLSNSFDSNSRKIYFELYILPEQLDISQAVPIGLILNEAITNSIKYAFCGAGGLITITADKNENNVIDLKIKDNGKGMPKDFDYDKTSSLGMEMLKALSKQLGGQIEIKSDTGVTINVRFKNSSFPFQ